MTSTEVECSWGAPDQPGTPRIIGVVKRAGSAHSSQGLQRTGFTGMGRALDMAQGIVACQELLDDLLVKWEHLQHG